MNLRVPPSVMLTREGRFHVFNTPTVLDSVLL